MQTWSEAGRASLRKVALGEGEAGGQWWTTVESAVGIPGMGERGGSSWSVGVD